MASLDLTALDGGTVSASGPDVPPTAAGCTAYAVLSVGSRLHEFTSGDVQFSRAQAGSMDVTETATYRMHGELVRLSVGEEVTAQGTSSRYLHVAWEARQHSLGTVMRTADPAAALALLDAIEIHEEANGIVLRPRDARVSIVQDSQHAPGVVIPGGSEGMLQISRASRYWDKQRPAWAGRKGRGGEIYAEQTHGRNATMLLFGARSVTRIYATDKDNGFAHRATEIDVDWA